MAADILINVQRVEDAIQKFDTQKGEFENTLNAIGSTLFDIDGAWTGKAEQAFEDQARKLLDNLRTVLGSMEGAKGKLKTAIADAKATEEYIQAAANSINSQPTEYPVG